MLMRPAPIFLSLSLLFLLSACSGVQQTEGQPRDMDEAQPAEDPAARFASFETFDPSMYTVTPPAPQFDIAHSVPGRLMQGEATRGVRRVVEGFRIQIFSTNEKSVADRRRAEARSWWEQIQQEEEVPEDLFPAQLPTNIAYRPPYYRVRIGSFAERERAEEALSFVRRKYPDAFIARSRVTITR